VISNKIVVGRAFFAQDATEYSLTLIHEALHVAFGMSDVRLAGLFGLGRFDWPGVSAAQVARAAGLAISDWLTNNCPPQ
jgi:hypothetical protein